MISNELKNFFGQLNFRLMATNVAGATIMQNEHNGEILYVVLLDNDNRQIWNTGVISAIQSQLASRHSWPDLPAHILFLVITDDPSRDRVLASLPGTAVWLADANTRQLLVYENQPDDYFGLRYGLEKTIAASSKGAWNIREAVKDKKNFPFVTVILVALNVIWFIVLSFMGDTTDPQFMWSMGADFGYSVFVDHEFYRLFLSMFMHFGFLHLFGNMVYLGFAGLRVERLVGHLYFFLIYMLSGLASSIISSAYYFLTGMNTVSAGASGAIYGIMGLMIYMLGKNRGVLGKGLVYRRIMLIFIFLVYSNFITPDVDVVAHVAGIIFGLLLSFAFLHKKKLR